MHGVASGTNAERAAPRPLPLAPLLLAVGKACPTEFVGWLPSVTIKHLAAAVEGAVMLAATPHDPTLQSQISCPVLHPLLGASHSSRWQELHAVPVAEPAVFRDSESSASVGHLSPVGFPAVCLPVARRSVASETHTAVSDLKQTRGATAPTT